MIRNHKSGKWVRYNSPHYRKLLKQQEETGEKIFLKKDIRHLNKVRVRTGGGDSETERRDAMIRQMNEEVDNRCNLCYRSVNELDVQMVRLSCKHTACVVCLAKHCTTKANDNLPCQCPFCNETIKGPSIILPRTIFIMHITVNKYRGVGAKVHEVGARAAARAKRAVRGMRANKNTVAPENTDDTPKKFQKMDYIREKIIDTIYEDIHNYIEENQEGMYKGIQVQLNKRAIKMELAIKYLPIKVHVATNPHAERVAECADQLRNYKIENPDLFDAKDVMTDVTVLNRLVFSGDLHDKGCDFMVSFPITATRGPTYSGPHVTDYSIGKRVVDDIKMKYVRSKNNSEPIITHYPTTKSRYPEWTVSVKNFYQLEPFIWNYDVEI